MNILKKGQMLILGLLVCYSSLEAAEQPTPEKRELRFSLSQESVYSWEWERRGRRLQRQPGDDKEHATHVAVFRLKHVRNWKGRELVNVTVERVRRVNRPGSEVRESPERKMVFERWTVKEEPSAEPRYFNLCLPEGTPVEPLPDMGLDREERVFVDGLDFLDEERELAEYEALGLMDKPLKPPVAEAPESTKFWVYGNSEKEARENAQTIIDLVAKLAYADVEKAKQGLRRHREMIEKLEAEIPELERKREEIEREIEEHKKTVHYSGDADARRSILEWTDLLNTIEVDLVGIKARLAKIKELTEKEHQKKTVDHEVQGALSRMQMAAEIDLASALARKEAAQSFCKKAADFIALKKKRQRASREVKENQDELAYSRRAVSRYEEVLAKLQAADIPPVELVDNEVVIHPVRVTEPVRRRKR